jgi:uncharacterized protein (TIGR04255 family)
MSDKYPHLPKAPLVEAIFEMQWQTIDGKGDSTYPLSVGRLYSEMGTEYPATEDLPIVEVPARMTMNMVRHRFRTKQQGWPLMQIGPGILTVNDTEAYRWEDFQNRIKTITGKMFNLYSPKEAIKIQSLLLRYINAIELDFDAVNVIDFLASKLKLDIKLPGALFEKHDINKQPAGFALQLDHVGKEPNGIAKIHIARGAKNQKPALIWELHFRSLEAQIPQLPEKFNDWLTGAHDLIEDWFIAMSKGDLLDSFSGKK